MITLNYNNIDDNLNTQGVLLLEGIFLNEVDAFLNCLDIKIDTDRYQKGLFNGDLMKYGINNFFNNATIAKIINKRFPQGAVYSNNCFYRSFKNCTGTRAHADHVYFKQEKKFVTIWVAIDDITIDMGPLYVFPHDISSKITDSAYLNQQIDSNDTTNNEGWQAAVINNIEYPLHTKDLKKGDCFIFNSDIVHGTLDNLTDKPRQSLDMRVADSQNYDKRWFN